MNGCALWALPEGRADVGLYPLTPPQEILSSPTIRVCKFFLVSTTAIFFVLIKINQNTNKHTALELPPSCILRSWIHVQLVSSCVDLTKVKCTPKLRCTAEQSIQINTPYVTVAHVGFFASQSKHV